MNNKQLALRAVAAAALALAAAAAQAHHPWLLPSASVVDGKNLALTVDAAVSEDLFEFDSFPLQVEALHVIAPDGTELPIEGRQDGKRRTSFDLKLTQSGTYRIAAVTDTAMASYKAGGETRRWRGPAANLAREVPADAQDLQVSRQLARAETFVTANEPGPLAKALAGAGIELVPLSNPTDLSTGDSTRFRLLLDGKPYANADVTVIRGGNRYRYKLGEVGLKTDAAGEFTVAWTEAGRYWLSASHGGRGGPGGPGGAGGQGGAGAAPQGAPQGAQGGPQGGPPAGRRESYTATFEVLPK
jgi:uncharacterized GH25 family protein